MLFGGRRKRPGEVPYAGMNTIKSNGIRMAKVTNVYLKGTEFAGMVDVKFLDGPGGRKYVIATQMAAKAWLPPAINDWVLVGFSHDGIQCFIIGYIPMEIRERLDPTTPKVIPVWTQSPGDVALQRAGSGQGIFLTADGNINVDNGAGGGTQYIRNTNTIEHKDINISLVTEAGSLFFGVVKRFLLGTINRGISQVFGKDGVISSTTVPALTEFVLRITGLSNNNVNDTDVKIETPVVEVRAGNVVNDFGGITPNTRAQVNVYSPDSLDVKCSVKMQDNGNIILQGSNISFTGVQEDLSVPLNTFVTFNEFRAVIDDLETAIKGHFHTANNALPEGSFKLKGELVNACGNSMVRVDTHA